MNLRLDLRHHYGAELDVSALLAALAAGGHDVDTVDADLLSGADEFHLGGQAATREVAAALEVSAGEAVLDFGCGIGGPARTVARLVGASVTGVDLTPAFIAAAIELSRRTGLADRVRFVVAEEGQLPFEDSSFSAAMQIHVGMNVPDKLAVFRELARVVRPGGRCVVYDIMQLQDAVLEFPLPWASDGTMSFVEDEAAYRWALEEAGFEVLNATDRSALVQAQMAAKGEVPPLNLSHLMGARVQKHLGLLRKHLAAGELAPIQVTARRR